MSGFYYIKIANGLLEPKHCEAMGESVWLYMWLQDKCTSVNENGEGKVLGNKPIVYETDIKPALGVPRRTYARWIERLRAGGYIKTIRTPAGLSIVITKQKKYEEKGSAKRAHHQRSDSDVPNQNITRDVPKSSSDVPNKTQDVPNQHIQYKTTQDYINTKQTYVNSDKPSAREHNRKILFSEIITSLGFTDKVRPTEGRLRKFSVRLKTFSRDELLKSAHNLGTDQYMQGDNDAGKRYGNVDYFIRSDEVVDKWLTVDDNNKPTTREDLSKYA